MPAAMYLDPKMVTFGEESHVVHIADGSRVQFVADWSVVAGQNAEVAAFERHVNGLWGVFIVSVLSISDFAFLSSQVCYRDIVPGSKIKGQTSKAALRITA